MISDHPLFELWMLKTAKEHKQISDWKFWKLRRGKKIKNFPKETQQASLDTEGSSTGFSRMNIAQKEEGEKNKND
jgi:hypothetical protein